MCAESPMTTDTDSLLFMEVSRLSYITQPMARANVNKTSVAKRGIACSYQLIVPYSARHPANYA